MFLVVACARRGEMPEKEEAASAGRQESGRLPDLSWFPSRMHAFVWRNWESVPAERMAKVLNTSPGNIRKTGLSMGLPPQKMPGDLFEKRGYISLIRRNWHLLSYEQLLVLLDVTSKQLDETLRDDDFLSHKLGGMRPLCTELKYVPPDRRTKKRCAEIKTTVERIFGKEMKKPGEERFAFVGKLSAVREDPPAPPAAKEKDDEAIRFVYSYFAPFGDPLLHPELDPFPEGLLQRLQQEGVNGVWLHVTLHQLTASKIFPELGEGHEIRLKNLRELAKRTQKYGIRIYLYMNEPRAMPPSFFKNHEEIKGVEERGLRTMCTSVPQVQQWMRESLAHIFSTIPELGGVFTITMSENLTSCWSHQHGEKCPRCSKRVPAEVIAEVNRVIAEGVWQGNPRAKVIVWDWGWPDGVSWGKNRWADDILERIPDNVYHMSVSEWGKPVHRGGIDTKVGEYSMSVVGPGPRALHLWDLAAGRGLKTIAKVQVNNTWELSAIPYLPVMNLVAEHISNLRKADVDGYMLSWSLGGYPSPNMKLVKYLQEDPSLSPDEALRRVAEMRYGEKAAAPALEAWSSFSTAFTEFPYGLNIYLPPLQVGAANPLYRSPTGLKATMIGFPYDDLENWRKVYPPEVLGRQFEKLAEKWAGGLPYFEQAVALAETEEQKEHATVDHRFAEVAWNHFKSVADQIQFIIARDKVLSDTLSEAALQQQMHSLEEIVKREKELAVQMYSLSKADSRIGFEASNHYYYLPLDFVEKVLNCEYVLKQGIGSHPFPR